VFFRFRDYRVSEMCLSRPRGGESHDYRWIDLSKVDISERFAAAGDLEFKKLALQVEPRALLHQRIAMRLDRMLDAGFTAELRRLMQRPGLHRDSPAMRAVGYRQFWSHLAGECTFEEAKNRALAATRQLAKRQITWLRSESGVKTFDALDSAVTDAISGVLAGL